MTRRWVIFALTVLGAAIAPNAAWAHEFGAMKVEVVFHASGDFDASITLFTEHLPPDLRAPKSGAEALDAYRSRFAAGATLAFDAVPTPVTLAPLEGLSPAASDEASLLIRLAGRVPSGAHAFTWSHAWPLREYLLDVRREGDAESASQWLQPGKTSEPFALGAAPLKLSMFEVVRRYLVLGFTHIVPKGLDHILFVLGLFLLSMRLKPILAQVTAFTVAHSITLALSMYGLVRLPASIVEPAIALSIVFVAVENLVVREFRWRRTAVVFGFGLLHGLGFAGVLTELGLPRGQFIPALVSFNVGVEAGQLAVLLTAYLCVGAWFEHRTWYRNVVTIPASCAIALVGAYWAVERITGV